MQRSYQGFNLKHLLIQTNMLANLYYKDKKKAGKIPAYIK